MMYWAYLFLMSKYIISPHRRLGLLDFLLEHHVLLEYLLALILLAHEIQTARSKLYQPRHLFIFKSVCNLVVKPHILLGDVLSPIS